MFLNRELIVQTAAALFQEKGYAATTVQDIADRLGCTKAALYYYVKGKEQLLRDIYDKAMTTAERRLADALSAETAPLERLRRVVRNHCLAGTDELTLMAVFFSRGRFGPGVEDTDIAARQHRYERTLAEEIRRAMAAGAIRPMPVTPVLMAILGMCNWLHRWYDRKGPLTPEDVADLYTGLVLDGLTPR